MPWVFSNRAKRAWWSVHIKAWRKSGLSASAYWAPSRSDAQRLQDLAAFERVAARDDVTLATCWAHTRRKFYDVEQKTGPPIAELGRASCRERVCQSRASSGFGGTIKKKK